MSGFKPREHGGHLPSVRLGHVIDARTDELYQHGVDLLADTSGLEITGSDDGTTVFFSDTPLLPFMFGTAPDFVDKVRVKSLFSNGEGFATVALDLFFYGTPRVFEGDTNPGGSRTDCLEYDVVTMGELPPFIAFQRQRTNEPPHAFRYLERVRHGELPDLRYLGQWACKQLIEVMSHPALAECIDAEKTYPPVIQYEYEG